MTTSSTNTERRLQSFINRGIVTQVDYDSARCRVQIDGLETDWLPFASSRMGSIKIWNPPSVGEQVLVISETGELATGLITSSFHYDDEPMPSNDPNTIEMRCKDGAVFSYSHDTHELKVSLPSDSTTHLVSKKITIDCDEYKVNCKKYAIACQSYRLDSQTNNQKGVLTINGQPYLSHGHKDVKSGSSNTGGVNA